MKPHNTNQRRRDAYCSGRDVGGDVERLALGHQIYAQSKFNNLAITSREISCGIGGEQPGSARGRGGRRDLRKGGVPLVLLAISVESRRGFMSAVPLDPAGMAGGGGVSLPRPAFATSRGGEWGLGWNRDIYK
jgi:hypothetical protein